MRQRSYVLPWSLFLYAEGTEEEVRAVFHTHVVVVEGAGLCALLQEFAAQTVTVLIEPERTAKFSPVPGPRVTGVSVRGNE